MPLEPEQQKALLKDFLGIDPEQVENLEAAKSLFSTNFVSSSEVANKTGKVIGSFETSAKRAFPEFDFNAEEVKGKKIEEKIVLAAQSVYSKLEELKKAPSGNTPEEIQKINSEWEKKFGSVEKKYNDLKGLHESFKQEHESKIQEFQTKAEQDSIRSEFDNSWKEIKFSPDFLTDNIKQTGFKAMFTQNYSLKKEDDGIKVYGKDGNPIRSAIKGSDYMGVKEAIETFAREANVLAVAPAAGKPAGGNQPYTPPQGKPDANPPERQSQVRSQFANGIAG